jgi:predicted NUDIX family NTP pyrophosphohydrolase
MHIKRNKYISAGFLVECCNGKYLLGKVYGKKSARAFTIFKGGLENDENTMDAAIRELKEEAGINVLADSRLIKNISSKPIFKYTISKKNFEKKVIVYLLVDKEGVLDKFKPKCCSYFLIDGKQVPEICEYGWFTLEELPKVLLKSQLGLVKELQKKKQFKKGK